MSKEQKLAKKEAKTAKKAAKTEKRQAKAYEKLVKKIDKKNAKIEKKANKKGKPFTPIPTPTQEEAFAGNEGGKVRKIILFILLILLIWYLVFFIYRFITFYPPAIPGNAAETTTAEEGEKEPVVYDRYVNEHEITTTPDYSVAEAKVLLKQVLHDQWAELGYSSDPSSGSINFTSNITNVNHSDCYVFTAGSKTFAVSTTLSSVYVQKDGKYEPLTFHNDDILF